MDPLSTVASVAGIITLVAQVLSSIKKYRAEAKRVDGEVDILCVELEYLSFELQRLKQFLQKNFSQVEGLDQRSVLTLRVRECEQRIQALKDKLDRTDLSRVQRIVRPLSKIDFREERESLRTVRQWIDSTLSLDRAFLLTKTSDDVVEMLNAQLHSSKQLHTIDSRTKALEDTLSTQTKALSSIEVEEQRHKLLYWLSNYDHEERHDEIASSRASSTGFWLFETDQFRNWHDEPNANPVLWCHGAQGAGKSVLT